MEFGRDVTRPDGTAGRTKTTLALLPDAQFPRLSFFLCQQHRPDLIYVPEWLEHPNSVSGICGVNILADTSLHAELKARFGGLYTGLTELKGGFEFQTANGTLRVMSADAFEREIGPLPNDLAQETLPCIAGMDLTLRDPDKLLKFLNASNLGYRTIPNGFALTDPALTANTLLRFLSK